MFIECREPPAGSWQAASDSNLDLLRDYRVYDALAGGRNGAGYLYPHKGLPDDLSDLVLKRACYRITDSEEEVKNRTVPEIVVKRRPGIGPPFHRIFRRHEVEYFHEINGGMHSHTWLTPHEVESSLRNAGIAFGELNNSHASILTQLRALEASGKEARLIVWFGNGPMPNRWYEVIKRVGAVLQSDWCPIAAAGTVAGADGAPPLGADEYSEFVGPVFLILTGSRSASELIELLGRAERENLGLSGSSLKRLRKVARKLLALDVSI